MARLTHVVSAWLATTSTSIRSGEVAFEAGRASSFANAASASSAAAELALHLRSLGEREPHHVCVTGNAAAETVDTFVLQGTGESRTDFTMPSMLSKTECTVQEAQLGNTLFTIAESLPDSCLPRWRAQSSSCDVLFHAHSGGDCTDLSKFRLVNDKCDADLLVVSDTQELSQCFDTKMSAHEKKHPGSACAQRGLWLDATEEKVGNNLVAAMKNAISKHSAEIKHRFFKADSDTAKMNAPLRERLLDSGNGQQTINVQDDLLKASQGLPSASTGSFAEFVNAVKTKGKSHEDVQAIVIDIGSGNVKAGPAGHDAPSVVFPAVIAKAKYDLAMVGIEHEKPLVGEAAQKKRGVHKLSHPVKHGIVDDWDGMVDLWTHTFDNELRINPAEHAVMLTECPANPKKNRERMTEIMFEQFQVQKLYVAMQAVLALYAAGKTTGLSIDSGDGVTHIVPVYDGYALPHAIQRIDLAGRDLTEYLMKLLMERGQFRPVTSAEQEITRIMKEKLSYVAQNFETEMAKAEKSSELDKPFQLPDGSVIKIGSERFRCAEPMFQPKMVGLEHDGIHTSAFQAIQDSDIDIRSDLYANIIISGGNSMIPGFAERLQYEIQELAPSHAKVNVIAKKQRDHAVWVGGSILSSLKTFENMWVTAQNYEDDGPSIVHKKCAY